MKITDQSETRRSKAEGSLQTPIASSQPRNLYEKLLDDTPLLKNEDKRRYRLMFETLVTEAKPESMLDWLDVKEYMDKWWEEQRYKTMTVTVVNGVRTHTFKDLSHNSEEREALDAETYLPLVETLSRLANSSANTRRSIQKDLRRMGARKESPSPSIAPE
jgi:hypothetical protein